MEIFSTLTQWISNNESFFSGMAALLVLAGFIFTIFRFVHRSFSGKQPKGSVAVKEITLQDLSTPSPFPIQFAKVDGLRIAFVSMGSAPETLIVCPGIVSNLHVSAHLPAIRDSMTALAEFTTVVSFDKRGQGLSDTIIGNARIEERIRDISAVAEASESEKFFLMGVSEGGPMSIRYAYEYPEKVKGLILFGSTAKFVQSEDYHIGLPESTLDALAEGWGKGRTRSIFFPSMDREVMSDDTYKSFERLLAGRDSMRQLVEYMKTLDVRDIATKISCPCLVIHFSGDMAIPARLGRALADSLPDSKFLEVAGIDHSDLAKAPDAVSAIKDFISKHS
jgi:pimeloyl-ACP methyl ester carboxylesterase